MDVNDLTHELVLLEPHYIRTQKLLGQVNAQNKEQSKSGRRSAKKEPNQPISRKSGDNPIPKEGGQPQSACK